MISRPGGGRRGWGGVDAFFTKDTFRLICTTRLAAPSYSDVTHDSASPSVISWMQSFRSDVSPTYGTRPLPSTCRSVLMGDCRLLVSDRVAFPCLLKQSMMPGPRHAQPPPTKPIFPSERPREATGHGPCVARADVAWSQTVSRLQDGAPPRLPQRTRRLHRHPPRVGCERVRDVQGQVHPMVGALGSCRGTRAGRP